MPTMVTISKAAEITGLTYSALRRWIKRGEFTYYVMAGSKYLINLERLVEFLNAPAPAVTAGGGVQRTERKL